MISVIVQWVLKFVMLLHHCLIIPSYNFKGSWHQRLQVLQVKVTSCFFFVTSFSRVTVKVKVFSRLMFLSLGSHRTVPLYPIVPLLGIINSLLCIWCLSDPLNKNLWTVWGKSLSHMFSCKGQDGGLRCRARGHASVSCYVLALKWSVVASWIGWEVYFLIFEL